jgi:DNA-binding PadR family transcriptional regulator
LERIVATNQISGRPLKPLIFLTLLILDGEPAHGYAIKKAILDRTNGAIDLEPGTLYRLIARLLRDGLIVESGDRPAPDVDDERRRYYRISDLGHDLLVAEAARLVHLVSSADVQRLIMEGGPR